MGCQSRHFFEVKTLSISATLQKTLFMSTGIMGRPYQPTGPRVASQQNARLLLGRAYRAVASSLVRRLTNASSVKRIAPIRRRRNRVPPPPTKQRSVRFADEENLPLAVTQGEGSAARIQGSTEPVVESGVNAHEKFPRKVRRVRTSSYEKAEF